jgi:glutathione S-transferase
MRQFHPEKLPSAIERYGNEIKRVLGVIDAHLKKTGNPYLVGEKLSFVDLMFVTWNHQVPFLIDGLKDDGFEKNYPQAHAWWKSLEDRASVKKVYAYNEKLKAESGGH